ncbi:MAG: DUF2723 domain-containing protein [Sphingobacteriales bacterium]|nr:MAG: DUF2723 domain-containing protein [Sphingobacteriales bacterium]
MNFRKINNLFGWVTGAIATLVYLKTMEPTTSFWDCGEFISCAYKLEVGHSPGAPLFMMIQRMFGILAGGNLEKVALMINAWSAIASGLTILFLFWTITHFAKKLVAPGWEIEPNGTQTALIIGSGLVGGLAYTFSDTFWFSAVEGEVYASSSVFTALVFWAILKWERIADRPGADRWLIFIAYMMGLSVGVHLLNLLAIPALAMVYYYRRYTPTTRGAITAFIIGGLLLGLVQFGVLQGLPILASKFDLLFVNSFGLPFDSGALTFIILLVGILVWSINYAKRKNQYLLHTGMLCMTFIIIGFSSYLAPLIRSRADVPIDMTNPDNSISLVSYIQREQFGSQPLLFGPDFDKRPTDYATKGVAYARSDKGGKDQYIEVGKKIEPVFDNADKRFFPRIWDYNDPGHIRFYKSYLGLEEGEAPTSADNFSYFFRYQIDWMWWRYFMWNYSGRQNDFEGQGGAKEGNWITGIGFLDKMMGRGDMDKMSDGYKNNAARNELFLLPFILGVCGLVYQFNRNREDGIIAFVLFFFTGIAIAIYLNMPPLQPRERDYAFAGSTYAYAIWIGLGVLMVGEWINRVMKGATGAYLAVALCLLAVPTLMAKEEWDDHDRSKKTLARATAYNALQSCAPNAILFTFGDNDTYPLWYLQEVEGVRKDIRIINMSLLGIDWYIDQLNYRINDADAVPMLWKKENYTGDKGNYVRYYNNPQIPQNRYFNLAEIMQFVISDNPEAKLQTMNGEAENYYPSKNFFIPIGSKDELIAGGLLNAADTGMVSSELRFTFPKDIATKDDLAILNIIAGIAQQGWKRPIYFGGGLPGDNYVGLDDYMQLEGVVYRLMPYKYNSLTKLSGQDMGSVNLAKSYDLFMNKFQWGGAERKDVYYDEKNRIMFAAYRINAARIATELSAKGQAKEAQAILDKVMEKISEASYYYDATAYYMAMAYYQIGAKDKARELSKKLIRNAEDDINYAMGLSENRRAELESDLYRDRVIIGSLAEAAKVAGDMTSATEFQQKLQIVSQKLGQPMQ